MASPRYAKVAEQIKFVVAQMLERRIKDPRLGFVTITDVRITGDGREATVFYTVLGTPEERVTTAAALESARGQIRTAVSRKLGMRFAPTIDFIEDAMPETSAAIEGLLAQVRAGDAELAAKAAGATYAGDADQYKKPASDDEDDEAAEGDEDE
jgi:ribosome-binding factor A